MSYPSAMLITHLQYLGPFCPGWRGDGHFAEDLTARTGRVLCRGCSDTAASLERCADGDA